MAAAPKILTPSIVRPSQVKRIERILTKLEEQSQKSHNNGKAHTHHSKQHANK